MCFVADFPVAVGTGYENEMPPLDSGDMERSVHSPALLRVNKTSHTKPVISNTMITARSADSSL